MSRQDYESLTQTEKAFIMKAYEEKIVTENQLINNAVANAIANVNRKKGKPWIPLWKKRSVGVDKEEMQIIIAKIKEETDNSWVGVILDANKQLAQRK